MLIILRPLSAGPAQAYRRKEFTAKEQNCCSQQGVIGGEWQGGLAMQFGLAGAVSAEDFARVSECQHPQTGEPAVRQRASHGYQDADAKTIKTMEHRAGWEMTFSAPPSVSLTALISTAMRVSAKHIGKLSALPLTNSTEHASAHRRQPSTALSLTPYYSPSASFCSFARVILFFRAAAQVK